MTQNKHKSDKRPSEEKTANFEVGYKKPPKRTQFVKGLSGNPKGRPKRPEGVSIKEILDSDQRGKNGEVISKREALVIRMMNDAMSGNQKAFARFVNFMSLAGLLRPEQPRHPGIIFFDGPRPSPEVLEEWKRRNGIT
jgi:Family of unknown function (DUF5681)